MAPTFKNTFSWSVSRDSVFRTCPRKYYFSYYGHWGGWNNDTPRRTREIYVLKQLKTRPTWIGQVVHDCIARSLQNISRGVPILGLDEILNITRSLMRQDFRHSKRKLYWHNPKAYAGFFEHEYDIDVTDAEWRRAAEDVDHCLNTFYSSDHFAALRAIPPDRFLEVEEFSSYYLDGFELRIKLDCAVRENERVVVWDWKTGKKESDRGLSLQMGCYALYAKKKYRVDLDEVLTRRFDLHRGQVHEHNITQRSLDEMTAYIRGSISDMMSLVDDPAENTASEERFSKVERPDVCLRCNFLRVCQPSL
ncbi:MAG: PD-(D/E)XK nuclease family protein [Candidatus Latescibacterota bacterium]|nr:MAG: PD-(D/E)XK nuclease family protein [Candidatus Latescibacterota bacterium]